MLAHNELHTSILCILAFQYVSYTSKILFYKRFKMLLRLKPFIYFAASATWNTNAICLQMLPFGMVFDCSQCVRKHTTTILCSFDQLWNKITQNVSLKVVEIRKVTLRVRFQVTQLVCVCVGLNGLVCKDCLNAVSSRYTVNYLNQTTFLIEMWVSLRFVDLNWDSVQFKYERVKPNWIHHWHTKSCSIIRELFDYIIIWICIL